jgi:hypothetical protein
MSLARRVRDQERGQRGPKVYSLHAPEVECIGKGKPHKPYEFGVKVGVATTSKRCRGGQFVTHVQALPGNPCDGHTLAGVIPAIEGLLGNTIVRLHTDAGYRGHNAPSEYKFKVYTAKQKRRVTPHIKRENATPLRHQAACTATISPAATATPQRHPRRRRIQLPPPDQVAHALTRLRPVRDLDAAQIGRRVKADSSRTTD